MRIGRRRSVMPLSRYSTLFSAAALSLFLCFHKGSAASNFVILKDGFPMPVRVSSHPVDICPNTPANEIEDALGCSDSQRDTDFDGISDADDICVSTAFPSVVNELGCSQSEMDYLNSQDQDGDSVPDYLDQCSDTAPSQYPEIDGDGCHPDQRDADEDGVPDYLDPYPLQHNSMCTAS